MATVHEELTIALGFNTPSYSTVVRWAKRLRVEREEVNGKLRSGCSISELTDASSELTRQVINNDLHSTKDGIIDDETWIYHAQIGLKSTNKS